MLFVLPISVLYIVPLVGGALVCAFYRYRISCPRCWGGVILSESVQTQSNPQPYPTRWYTRIRRPSPIDTTRILPKDVLVSEQLMTTKDRGCVLVLQTQLAKAELN